MNDQPETTKQAVEPLTTTRRQALARLGLAAGAVYIAPTILKLDTKAYAQLPIFTSCPPIGTPGRPSSCPAG